MPEFSVDEVTRIVKDAAYVTIGFGVIAAQKAQVQRRELTEQIQSQIDQARTQLNEVRENLEHATASTTAQWDKVSRHHRGPRQADRRAPQRPRGPVRLGARRGRGQAARPGRRARRPGPRRRQRSTRPGSHPREPRRLNPSGLSIRGPLPRGRHRRRTGFPSGADHRSEAVDPPLAGTEQTERRALPRALRRCFPAETARPTSAKSVADARPVGFAPCTRPNPGRRTRMAPTSRTSRTSTRRPKPSASTSQRWPPKRPRHQRPRPPAPTGSASA